GRAPRSGWGSDGPAPAPGSCAPSSPARPAPSSPRRPRPWPAWHAEPRPVRIERAAREARCPGLGTERREAPLTAASRSAGAFAPWPFSAPAPAGPRDSSTFLAWWGPRPVSRKPHHGSSPYGRRLLRRRPSDRGRRIRGLRAGLRSGTGAHAPTGAPVPPRGRHRVRPGGQARGGERGRCPRKRRQYLWEPHLPPLTPPSWSTARPTAAPCENADRWAATRLASPPA